MLQYEWRKCGRKTTKIYKRNRNIEGCQAWKIVENLKTTLHSRSYCKIKGIQGKVGEVGWWTNLQHCVTKKTFTLGNTIVIQMWKGEMIHGRNQWNG